MAAIAKALATVKEMLVDRGVGLGELEAVGEAEAARLATLDFFHVAAEDRDVVVITRRLKNQDLQKAAATLDAGRRDRAILIMSDKATSVNRSCVLANYGPGAEMFVLSELQYNVSRHHLVPPHARLAEPDVRALLKAHMLVDKRSLPAIAPADPMAKYLGLRPGDVVRITHASPTAGESLYYRHCR